VQCLRLGVRPLLLDRRGRPGGLTVNAWRIENYPGLEPVDGRTFAARLADLLMRFELTVEQAEVTGIDVAERGFLVDLDTRTMTARAVILATGTRAIRLDCDGARALEGERLFYEVAALFERYPEPGRVIVIGGGEAALDYSLSLAGRGAEVTLLVRGDRCRANVRLLEAVAGEDRIGIHFGIEIAGIAAAIGGVRVLTCLSAGKREFESKVAIAAIGREPAPPSLPEGFWPDSSGTVATALPGLFLAGDLQRGSLGQAGIAVGDGLEAAQQAVTWLKKQEQQ